MFGGSHWKVVVTLVHLRLLRYKGTISDRTTLNRMKLTGAPSDLMKGDALPKSERLIVGSWLASRLDFYHRKIGKHQKLPGQQAVANLIQSGLSPLKRRYQLSDISAHAVAWGWLGREGLVGRIDSSVERPRQGGTTQGGWLWSAMVEGGWLSATAKVVERQRQEKLISCLPRCSGAILTKGGWYLGSHCLSKLYQMLRRHYPDGKVGIDLLALDVAYLTVRGALSGDCLRYKSGGHLDTEWWARLSYAIAEYDLPVSCETIAALEPAVKQWYHITLSPAVSTGALTKGRCLWVLDLCCGFRSLDKPVEAVLTSLAGVDDEVLCIGLDICPRQIRCSEYIEPDICADLLDDSTFPPGAIIESICAKMALEMSDLVHVHASPPCITNSRADASNLKRGCGYRDWHHQHCRPLPSMLMKDRKTPPEGFTTIDHRQLAVDHDRLEKKLFASLVSESTKHHFTFTVENPVGM